MDAPQVLDRKTHGDCLPGLCLWVCSLLMAIAGTSAHCQESRNTLTTPVFPHEQPEGASFRSLLHPAVEPQENQNGVFDNVFRGHSREPSAQVDRLIALLEQKQYWKARKQVDAALELEPGRRSLYLIRAFLRCMTMKIGDTNALAWAEYDLKQGKQYPEEAFPAGVWGCIATRQCQYQLAIDHFSWAIEKGADFDEFRILRACAYMKLRKPEQAVLDLECVVGRDPSIYEVYRYLGYCHAELGMWEKALDALERAIRLRPRDLEPRYARVELALNCRKYDIALTDLDRLAADHPDFAHVLLVRSIVRWVAGKGLDMARTDIDRAIKLEPRDWSFHAFRAYLDFRQAEYAKAMGDLACCSLALNYTKFAIRWKYETLDDGTERFFIGVFWRLNDGKGRPNNNAETGDLEHKLVDLGIRTLWGSKASRTEL